LAESLDYCLRRETDSNSRFPDRERVIPLVKGSREGRRADKRRFRDGEDVKRDRGFESGSLPSKNRRSESSPLEATAVGMRQADYLVHRAERLDEIGRCRLKRIEPVGLPRARDYSNGIIPLKYGIA
jgi:hypothetical protein